MNHRIAPLTWIALVSVSSVACDKPGVTEKQKETQAGAEVRSAANEAQQQVQGAQAEAEKTISAARADFETMREDYLHRRRIALVDLDKKIADLDANAKIATGQVKTDMRARLPVIYAQRDAFDRHMQALSTATAATWDGAAATLDKEWDALKKAVDNAR